MGPSLEDLLEIENDSAFLEFRCARTNYLLWPLARQQFLRQLISDLYYRHASLLSPVGLVPPRQILTALPKVLLHNWRRGKLHGDVLVLGTGTGNFLRDGRWFNRITDYLALASPADTVSIEGVVDWRVPEPRWNRRLGYWLPWQVAITLAGRYSLRNWHVASARAVLGHARQRAEALLGLRVSERSMQMLTGLVARRIARLPLMREAYRRMLEAVRPRLVLLEEGCYGDRGVFNHVAREMGVRVAEPQHGMVSGGHDAYRYARLLRESESYLRYLPHDFLGYGRWWNEQINAPVNKWVIGHPHHSENRRDLDEAGRVQNDILILSDGVEFALYLVLAEELSGLLGSRYRVVLRPHPLERERVYKDYPDGRAGAVVIDRNRDIYQSFASAHAVAGEVSTGLFEAIGMASRVLLWETAKARFSYPRHPFATFVDARTFAEAILAPAAGQSDAIQEDLWASDWSGNYRRYLEHALQGAPA